MADDGLKLNNKELVGRALDVIQTALQDLIISEMRFKYGRKWWSVAVVPKIGSYNLPIETPRHEDVEDDEVRMYMDIPVCFSMLKNESLLSEGYRKDSNKLLYEMKGIRNKKSHFGKPTYTAKAAREAIEQLIQLDDVLDLEVGDQLKSILDSVHDEDKPQQSESPAPPSETSSIPAPDSSSQTEPEPVEETVTVASEIPGVPVYDIRNACRMSCDGIYQLLEEKQANDSSSSRFTTEVKWTPRLGAYKLTLFNDMAVDDSTGVMVDGMAFSSGFVNFDGYDRATRKVTMYRDFRTSPTSR